MILQSKLPGASHAFNMKAKSGKNESTDQLQRSLPGVAEGTTTDNIQAYMIRHVADCLIFRVIVLSS